MTSVTRLSAAVTFFVMSLSSGALGVCGVCGDANGDGVVNIVDALFIAQFTVGLRPSLACPVQADVAPPRPGINITDALFIAQFTVGLRLSLTCLAPTPTPTPTPTVTPVPAACGNGVVDAGEDCDDGGICIGGSNAGTACTSEAQCPGDGVCIGGTKIGVACASDADCPSSQCVRCRPFGGDGCAANCTFETNVPYNLVAGNALNPLTTSTAQLISENLNLTGVASLRFSGSDTLTIGKQRNGEIPVVVKVSSVNLPGIKISTLACACVRGIEAKTCGGTVFLSDGVTLALDCTFADTCAANSQPPCASIHGPGNTASGVIGCTSLDGVNFSFTQDAGGVVEPTPPTPPPGSGPPVVTLSGTGGPGSALLLQTLRIGNGVPVTGSPGNPCVDVAPTPNPDFGADKTFCTTDDPDTIAARGSPQTLPAVTGMSQAQVLNHHYASNIVGPLPTAAPLSRTGTAFNCTALTNPTPSASGTQLVGAFTALNQVTLGDITVADGLVAQ